MFPTQQRLHPDDAEVVEVVDRLVGEAELIVDECRTQFELELHVAGDLCLQLGEVHLVAVLPGTLGVVQRDVRIPQQLSARRAIADGDADAGVHHQRHRDALELERLAHHIEQSLGDELWRRIELGIVDQDDELVTTHPADRVGIAQRARQPRGNGDEQPVAGLVAEGVVDVLEVVEVDEQRRPCRPVALAAGEELLDAVHDQRPVRQVGQRVVQRLMAQLVGAFGDKAERPGPPRAQHQHQRRDENAECDACDEQGERAALEQATRRRRAERLDGPPVAEVDRQRFGVVGYIAERELGVRAVALVAHRHGHLRVILQRALQKDRRHRNGADPSHERLTAAFDRRPIGAVPVHRHVHAQQLAEAGFDRLVGARSRVPRHDIGESSPVGGAEVETGAGQRHTSHDPVLGEAVELSITRRGDLERSIIREVAHRIGDRGLDERRQLGGGHDHDEAEAENLGETVHVMGGRRPVDDIGLRRIGVGNDIGTDVQHQVVLVGDRQLQRRRDLRRRPLEHVARLAGCAALDRSGREHRADDAAHDQHDGHQHPQVVALRPRESSGRLGT